MIDSVIRQKKSLQVGVVKNSWRHWVIKEISGVRFTWHGRRIVVFSSKSTLALATFMRDGVKFSFSQAVTGRSSIDRLN